MKKRHRVGKGKRTKTNADLREWNRRVLPFVRRNGLVRSAKDEKRELATFLANKRRRPGPLSKNWPAP